MKRKVYILIFVMVLGLTMVVIWRMSRHNEAAYRAFTECVRSTPETNYSNYFSNCRAMSKYGEALVPVLIDAFETRRTVAEKVWQPMAEKIPEGYREHLPNPVLFRDIHETACFIVAVGGLGNPHDKEAVGRVGRKVAPRLLEDACNVSNSDLDRGIFLADLMLLGPSASTNVAVLIGLLRDPSNNVKVWTTRVLGCYGAEAAAAVVSLNMLVLDESSSGVRQAAIDALGEIGPLAQVAITNIVSAVKDRDEFVRISAVVALGKVGPGAKLGVPSLLDCLNDKNLRLDAATSIWQIDTNQSPVLISFLTKRLDDPKSGTVTVARCSELLGKMAVTSDAAYAALLQLRRHPRKLIQDEADKVLKGEGLKQKASGEIQR